jgi:hypothetical protein
MQWVWPNSFVTFPDNDNLFPFPVHKKQKVCSKNEHHNISSRVVYYLLHLDRINPTSEWRLASITVSLALGWSAKSPFKFFSFSTQKWRVSLFFAAACHLIASPPLGAGCVLCALGALGLQSLECCKCWVPPSSCLQVVVCRMYT